MLRRMEVLARMAILRIIATSHVPARPAKAQVDPRVACPEAVLAAARVRLIRLYLIKVRAARSHTVLGRRTVNSLVQVGFWPADRVVV